MRPLRVAHLIADLDVGGAEVMLRRLLGAIDRSQVESIVISLGSQGTLAAQIRTLGIPVAEVGGEGVFRVPRAARDLVRRLRDFRPDVIQTWLYGADLAGILVQPFTGFPQVAWNVRCGQLSPQDHSPLLGPVLRLLALLSRRPAVVVCNSEVGRLAHERLGYRPRRWVMFPNGFDVDEFTLHTCARAELRTELGLAEQAPVAGMVARLHPMKDHATFLRAAAAVSKVRPDVHFVLVGRGVRQSTGLDGLIRELKLTTVVHRLDERADVSAMFAAFDVAVSSSYSEAFPNVVAEAMASGTPCVVTDTGESAAIVGETGLVVPPRNPPALAEAILRLLALERDEREGLGTKARDRIRTEYAIDRVARRYEALYAALAGQGA